MKSFFLLLFIVCSLVTTGNAQSTATLTNIYPAVTAAAMTDVKIATEDIWLVRSTSAIFLTQNAGYTWQTIPLPDRRTVFDFEVWHDGNEGLWIFLGTDTGLVVSGDRGASWYLSSLQGQLIRFIERAAGKIYALGMEYDATFGYVAKQITVYDLATHGGITLSAPERLAPAGFTASAGIIYFLGYTASDTKLFRSTNNGSSWRVVTGITNPLSFPVQDIVAYGKNLYMLLAFSGRERTTLLSSADSGNTFQVYAPLQADTLYHQFTFDQTYGVGVLYSTVDAKAQLMRYNLSGSMDFTETVFSSTLYKITRFRERILGVTNPDMRKQALMLGDAINSPGVLTDYNFSEDLVYTYGGLFPGGVPFFLTKNGAFFSINGKAKLYTYTGFSTEPVSGSAPDDSTVYVAGKSKYLAKSYDGGKTFSARQLSVEGEIRSIHFLSQSEGLMITDGLNIYRTTNAGDIWVRVYQANGFSGNKIVFQSRDTGYVIGSGILRTTNKGLTWVAVSTLANPSFDIFNTIAFDQSGRYGYAASYYEIQRSTNFGDTWFTLPLLPGTIQKMFVEDANNVEAFGYESFGISSFVTTNAGTSWSRKKIFPGLSQIIFGKSPKHLWGFDGYQGIFKSNNNYNIVNLAYAKGATDDIVSVNLYSEINRNDKVNSLQFVLSVDTSKVSFLGFTSGASASTPFLTSNWEKVVNFTQPGKMSVAAYGTDSLYLAGNLLSLDFKVKPNSSERIPVSFDSFTFNTGAEPTYTFNGVILKDSIRLGDVDQNYLVQAYDAAQILRSLANLIPPLSRKSMRQADVTADGTVSALDASIIARYVVGLVTSLPNPGPSESKGSVQFVGTRALGNNTFAVSVKLADVVKMLSLQGELRYDASALNIVSVTWKNAVSGFIKETNMKSGIYSFALAGSLEFTSPSAELAEIVFERIAQNSDGNTEISLNNFRMNEHRIQAEAGKTTVSLLSSSGTDNSLPKDFALYNNYPNPFNPSTVLSYDLPEQAFVTISVFDVLGSEVMSLVNENKAAGRYTVRFDATQQGKQLQAGIYFYRITAGKFTAVRKMMLLK